MKKRNLLLGSIGVAAVATAVILSPIFDSENLQATYSPEDNSEALLKSAKGHKEFYDYWHTNHETGELMDDEDFARQRANLKEIRQNRSTLLSWKEQGPSNIGGRTRAICIDKNDRHHLMAGSVTGGLWQSFDGANTWSQIEAYDGDFHISTIAQTVNGKYYVGTGMSYGGFEGYNGDGIHVSADNGMTWAFLAGSENMSRVQEIATDNVSNNVWIGDFQDGLYKSVDGALPTLVSGTNNLIAGGVGALSVSPDGQLIVVGIAGFDRKTFVSNDGGNSFTEYSDGLNTNNPIVKNGVNRVEYSISGERVDGEYYVYAAFSATSSHFGGSWVSQNGGRDWFETAPAVTTTQVNDNDPELFNPVASGSNPQGAYNLVVAATPWNATGCFVGGIDLYRWKRQVDSPPFGDYKQVSQWFASPQSSSYVHADNHEIKFDIYNRMYIGNDGGIGVCDLVWPFFESGFGLNFYPANRNYNVTQFYDVSFSGHGDLIGGTQDNGTLYNDHTNHAYTDFVEVLGGDGFDADISAFNRNVMFGSSQYNNMSRSNDGGVTWNAFLPPLAIGTYGAPGVQSGLHPFHSKLRLAEFYDENSLDSITYIPTSSYTSGDPIRVSSLSSGDTIDIVAPYDLLYQDTLNYSASADVTEYIVRDSISGTNLYDLGILDHTTAPFITSSNLMPPVIGDSILILNENGINDTIMVAEVMPYDYHFGVNPIDGRLLPMHMDEQTYGVSWDTLRVQDPYQSWYVMYTLNNGGELWATRDALRFSAANPQWGRIMTNIGSLNQVNFSKDLDRMFVAGSNGLKVIEGLASIYTQEVDFLEQFDVDEGATAVAAVPTTGVAGNVGSVAIDYSNPDNVIAASTNGTIFKSTNATGATINFGGGIPSVGAVVYDVEIVQDVAVGGTGDTYYLAGTDEGLVVIPETGGTWEDCSEGFGKVPVYTIKYAWRTYDEGNLYYGSIYVGTHGRGAFRSDSFLGMPDDADYPNFAEGIKTDMTVFPNPVSEQASIGFVLNSEEDVTVEIYNLAGRLVKRMPKTHMQKGQNQMSLDIEGLNAGTYVVKMTAGSNSDVTKFVKSK